MAAIDMHYKFALLVCITMAKLRRKPLQHIYVNDIVHLTRARAIGPRVIGLVID